VELGVIEALPASATAVARACGLERGRVRRLLRALAELGLTTFMGDEWRIGLNEGPFPYWTNPEHQYQANELVICAMQYACPEEDIGFRYENPILILGSGCEPLSKFPLTIEVIE
ncbi:MAG: helix-turn-helix domain-containing protein, partial [Chloroflexi bacterium]|nr:helix-turn-helix domain-containing protein [Chloroflexota bacterium]